MVMMVQISNTDTVSIHTRHLLFVHCQPWRTSTHRRTAPAPNPLASTSNLNGLAKSGAARTGELLSNIFTESKALWQSGDHTNGTPLRSKTGTSHPVWEQAGTGNTKDYCWEQQDPSLPAGVREGVSANRGRKRSTRDKMSVWADPGAGTGTEVGEGTGTERSRDCRANSLAVDIRSRRDFTNLDTSCVEEDASGDNHCSCNAFRGPRTVWPKTSPAGLNPVDSWTASRIAKSRRGTPSSHSLPASKQKRRYDTLPMTNPPPVPWSKRP
ncbi:uncharacterized protein LOC125728831 [Brienomyrus brachyistius]|uniref:uncharacterized protein LOC125728356 n=1 Tax=Brienomyrus brachyistius TaxID=42636 RepID=UPI0020B214AE|nr:uncharacterized protein LOC125728356 [Brienomyrus brachyistius]XP_048861471.1 uncharacterized protein LOC125728831 [Brienomyrus brachyistius]